jgi:hypothetical protein
MISRYTQNTTKFTTEKRNLDIINFDTDNLYPFHTENMSVNSGILETCQNIYAKFIYGGGFSEDIWKKKVNEKENIDKFFRKLIKDFSKHRGFAVHLRYNGFLEVIELKHVPFYTLRLKYPDEFGNINKIKYSKDWTTSRKIEIIEYDVYSNDKEVIAGQIENAGGIENWKGQIYYYGEDGNLEYPTNSFHSVIEDVVTDIQVKKGKNSNAMTNFMAPYVVEVPFDFEKIAKEQGLKRSETRAEFMKSLEGVQGFDNSGKYILLENDTRDADGKPREVKFHKLDLQNYKDIFEYAENSVQSNIRKKFYIPEIFINPVSTGFSTEIMNDQFHLMTLNTKTERQIFEEVAMEILPAFVGNVEFGFIPFKYKEEVINNG